MDRVSGDFVQRVLQSVSTSTRFKICNTRRFRRRSLSGVWGSFEEFFEMYTLKISICDGELFLQTGINTGYGLPSLPPDFSFWKPHRSAFSQMCIENRKHTNRMHPLTDDAVKIIEKLLKNQCHRVDALRLPNFGLAEYPSIAKILKAIPGVNQIYARCADNYLCPFIERWADTLWEVEVDPFEDASGRLADRIIENLSKRKLGSLRFRVPKSHPDLYRRFLNAVFFDARAKSRHTDYDSEFQDVIDDFMKTFSVSESENGDRILVDNNGIRFSFTDRSYKSNANGWRLWFFFY
ncbi:hypothetical protein QR680_006437 [Steinernema hermaphroditum]|uniref:Uncharacterized protein n=1 Tax=Steinernema hermaphroditum TaxID=289476 RepID=A0AA39LX49_9BILA|nr:hypothetical protein QR680_006437 [Steinernema hermaphroditum]